MKSKDQNEMRTLQPQTYLHGKGLSHHFPLSAVWHDTCNVNSQEGGVFTLQKLTEQIIHSRQEALKAKTMQRAYGYDTHIYTLNALWQVTAYLNKNTKGTLSGFATPHLPPLTTTHSHMGDLIPHSQFEKKVLLPSQHEGDLTYF